MNLGAIKNRIAAVERVATPEKGLADALRRSREAALEADSHMSPEDWQRRDEETMHEMARRKARDLI